MDEKIRESVEEILNDTAADDPFSPENIGILQFIMLSRIYDLLMLDLDMRNPEAAKKVLEIHRRGALMGVPPVLNGEFLSDM